MLIQKLYTHGIIPAMYRQGEVKKKKIINEIIESLVKIISLKEEDYEKRVLCYTFLI